MDDGDGSLTARPLSSLRLSAVPKAPNWKTGVCWNSWEHWAGAGSGERRERRAVALGSQDEWTPALGRDLVNGAYSVS